MIRVLKFLKDKLIILNFTICICFPGNVLLTINAQQIGQVFPSWSDGYMDIHHINTGKGESTFFILPDGTTGPVDVCVANHHAFHDAMSASFLEYVRPRVHIILSWSPSHLSHSTIARMLSRGIYPGPRDLSSALRLSKYNLLP